MEKTVVPSIVRCAHFLCSGTPATRDAQIGQTILLSGRRLSLPRIRVTVHVMGCGVEGRGLGRCSDLRRYGPSRHEHASASSRRPHHVLSLSMSMLYSLTPP